MIVFEFFLKLIGLPTYRVVDSTGLKIYSEGEWKVRQYEVGKRRTWRKVHLAVDGHARMLLMSKSLQWTGQTVRCLKDWSN
jgi:hypothetical protein